MQTKSKNVLIVAALDGIASLYSGVGVVVNSIFRGYDAIHNTLNLDEKPDLYAIVPSFDRDAIFYNEKVHSFTESVCGMHGGKVIFLPSFCQGESLNNIWGGNSVIDTKQQWESVSLALASQLSIFEAMYSGDIIVQTHDTLFAGTSKYIISRRTKLCWIPHSLSVVFKDKRQQARINFETQAIADIVSKSGTIGFISGQTRALLETHFQVPTDRLVSFYSGIIHARLSDLEEQNHRETLFDTYSIPRDKPLIFSWGRCVYQKGIDLIIQGYANAGRANNSKPHLVLLCPTDTTPSEYLEEIKTSLSDLSSDEYTFISQYNSLLPQILLGFKNTKIIILASRFEGFGLISLETLAYKTRESFVIYSPLETFREVLGNYERAIELADMSSTSITECIDRCISLSGNRAFNSGDPKLHLERYDFVRNYIKGFNQLLLDKTSSKG